jgi:hypothetical protein
MLNAIRCFFACTALAAISAVAPSTAFPQVPAPPPPAPMMPPSLVPSLSVNLMTTEGSATFGAVWKTMEAHVVETTPMQGRMPGYDKTYDMVPHAGEAGFDHAKWPVSRQRGSPTVAAAAGPISVTPAKFIFFRQASIEFYK